MKHNVPDVEAVDGNGRFVREIAEIQCERDKVRRIEPPDAPFPKREEIDYRLLDTGCARLGPVKVNTKTGDDEEEIYAGKREVNDVGSDLR
jgi:hypothetical protein